MENEIEKLVCEYQNKISNCNTLLNSLKTTRTLLCRDGTGHAMQRTKRAMLSTQLAAYQQAKADIESLLDHVEDSQVREV